MAFRPTRITSLKKPPHSHQTKKSKSKKTSKKCLICIVLLICCFLLREAFFPVLFPNQGMPKSKQSQCHNFEIEISAFSESFPSFSLPATRATTNRHNPISLFLFFHVPKTGGTTIRSLFGQYAQRNGPVRSFLSLKRKDYRRTCQAIERHLRKQNGIKENDSVLIPSSSSATKISNTIHEKKNPTPIVFVEFHGQGFQQYDAPEQLRHWKELSELYGSRIFTFTLWRHPIAHAKSYYHHLINQTDVEGESLDSSGMSYYNRQCSMFVSRPTRQEKIATLEDCLEAYNQIISQLDWIGTTENMDTVTIPLLVQLINNNNRSRLEFGGKSVTADKNMFSIHKNVGNYHRNISDSSKTMTVVDDPLAANTREESILQHACADYVIWKDAEQRERKVLQS